ncbi:hypothetical protein EDB86DRAFT_2831438, partial [Lactarius hatsudake]
IACPIEIPTAPPKVRITKSATDATMRTWSAYLTFRAVAKTDASTSVKTDTSSIRQDGRQRTYAASVKTDAITSVKTDAITSVKTDATTSVKTGTNNISKDGRHSIR